MPTENLEAEYEKLVREELGKPDSMSKLPDDERRFHPRFKLHAESVWIKVDTSFRVIDMSLQGLSMYSDRPFEAGHQLKVMVGKAFLVETEVIDCEMLETDPELMETQYRVSCRFLDESVGKQLLVMMKELDDMD